MHKTLKQLLIVVIIPTIVYIILTSWNYYYMFGKLFGAVEYNAEYEILLFWLGHLILLGFYIVLICILYAHFYLIDSANGLWKVK